MSDLTRFFCLLADAEGKFVIGRASGVRFIDIGPQGLRGRLL